MICSECREAAGAVCQLCLDRILLAHREEGYKYGYEAGHTIGLRTGYRQGFEEGRTVATFGVGEVESDPPPGEEPS